MPNLWHIVIFNRGFFEVVLFAIGYFTLKIITLWRYPKSFVGAMRFDILIYLVAFIDMILVVYLIARMRM
ncbi:MAG: hypothetical protein KU38_03630 [Sulfurovum sp. FS08-3]|nr:MAG: hypothetical protein KU38_03630 [Sulfurovum sp. FS08-3]